MKIKVCGMRENIREIARLEPDFMGFIFWPDSSRYIPGPIPKIPRTIERVGVMVDAELQDVVRLSWEHNLDYVQLHGAETPEYCAALYNLFHALEGDSKKPEIIKAFNVDENFDFTRTEDYYDYCSYFLFDAKGKLPGGNSRKFKWTLLRDYKGDKPFFLSGGINPGDVDDIKNFMQSEVAKFCTAVDVNSGFEISPAKKDPKKLKEFIRDIKGIN